VNLPALQKAVWRLAPQARLTRAWELKGGISAQMTALEIEEADGRHRKMILRRPAHAEGQAASAIEREFRLLELLHKEGMPVPQPFQLDASGEIFPEPCLMMAYIEGEPNFAPRDPAAAGRQMAEQLARLHRVDGRRADLAFLPHLDPDVELKREPGGVDAALGGGRIRAALEQHRLAACPAPALLHGDFWPGNVLWRDGSIAGVIDWEDAALGDPLADAAIARLDLLWIWGREAFEAFTAAYQGLTRADFARLPGWDLRAALRLIRLAGADLPGWAAFFAPCGRGDITEQTIRDGLAFFIAQALERLEENK